MKIKYPEKVLPVDFSGIKRLEFLENIERQTFDLCIIGGGITGAGIAWDATLRGLKTVLIEKADFGAGTSTKSSKLIHGGFRYLKQYQFGLVHESLVERYKLLHLAPHIVSRLPSIFPIFSGAKQGYWQIKAGMVLYDLLCGFQKIGKHHMLSKDKLLESVPFFREDLLLGGAHYYDAKADDFRLLISVIQNMVLYGGQALNYLEAVGFDKKGGKVQALFAVDRLTKKEYTIRAKVFVNATGPWSDLFLKKATRKEADFVRPTKGIHIIVPREKLPLNYGLMILSVVDDRPIFAIPWENFILIGTTDTEFDGNPDVLWSTPDDVQYVLDSINYYFSGIQLQVGDIISSFAGLRPLVQLDKKTTAEVPREHHIFEYPGNMFNIVGGKLTTFRRMAIDFLDYVAENCTQLKIPRKTGTGHCPLYGSEVPDYLNFSLHKKEYISNKFGVSEPIANHLLNAYGCHVDELLDIIHDDSSLIEPIVAGLPFIHGQLDYSIKHEMTISLDDFLLRRTHILSLDWDQGINISTDIAERMGRILGWDAVEKIQQIERYKQKVALTRKFRD